jgi:hypothetical protein
MSLSMAGMTYGDLLKRDSYGLRHPNKRGKRALTYQNRSQDGRTISGIIPRTCFARSSGVVTSTWGSMGISSSTIVGACSTPQKILLDLET